MGKSVTHYREKRNNIITCRLDEDDLDLFVIAMNKYDMDEGKLVKKIIDNWLFDNKLALLRGKNDSKK